MAFSEQKVNITCNSLTSYPYPDYNFYTRVFTCILRFLCHFGEDLKYMKKSGKG